MTVSRPNQIRKIISYLFFTNTAVITLKKSKNYDILKNLESFRINRERSFTTNFHKSNPILNFNMFLVHAQKKKDFHS